MEVKITPKEYMEYIELVAKRIKDNKDYISELDSVTGDGDHWFNMNMGFEKLLEKKETLEKMNLSDMFKKIGMILMSTIGGSSGALYGGAYIKAAKVLDDVEFIDVNKMLEVYETKLSAIMDLGKTKPGYKTMVDTLYVAVNRFKDALNDGKSEEEALKEFKKGAIDGMNSTKDMEAVRGRAYYQANRGVGHLDPGAVTMSYQIEELVDYIIK